MQFVSKGMGMKDDYIMPPLQNILRLSLSVIKDATFLTTTALSF